MPKTLSPADIETFRSRLCDIAEGLFAAHGPDGVTMRELAEAMGVSSMTAYRYFEDKDAILAAVRTRAFSRFAGAMEQATVQLLKAGARGQTQPHHQLVYDIHATQHLARILRNRSSAISMTGERGN